MNARDEDSRAAIEELVSNFCDMPPDGRLRVIDALTGPDALMELLAEYSPDWSEYVNRMVLREKLKKVDQESSADNKKPDRLNG